MAKHTAQPHDAEAVATYLHAAGLAHLRTRRRADLIIIESGADEEPWPYARLRRVGVHRWMSVIFGNRGNLDRPPEKLDRLSTPG